MSDTTMSGMAEHEVFSGLTNIIFKNTTPSTPSTPKPESPELKYRPEFQDKDIWRYRSFGKFQKIIENRQLWFSNPRGFDDPYENRYPIIPMETLEPIKAIPGIDSPTYEEKREALTQFIMNNVHINCWHINPAESSIMWEKYDAKVAVKSTYKQLLAAIISSENYHPSPKSLNMSDVTYIDSEGWGKAFPFERLRPFLLKRSIHQYENELRAITDMTRGENTIPNEYEKPDGYAQPVDLDILIERIVVSPSADEAFLKKVKDVVGGVGLDVPVVDSRLDHVEGVFSQNPMLTDRNTTESLSYR